MPRPQCVMVTKTNKIHTFQINVLIQFLVSSTCFEHCGFTIRKTIVSILISITSFHLLDCLHKQNITIQHVQMVFLIMNAWCSKHVEDTKNWIKTSIWKKSLHFVGLRYIHSVINPLNADLNPICHLLALLGAHPILYISRIRVKLVWPTPY